MAKKTSKPAVDVLVSGGGSIFIFTALTQIAKDWVSENVSEEGFNPDLPNRVYVEHRYARDLAQGMIESGLRVV